MKKSILKKTIIAAVLAVATIFSASALEATVLSVKGKVEVQKGASWIPVKAGDVIQKGAVISTGFKSEAVLKVKESKFTLASLTRITVEQLAETSAKDETQLYLDSGKVGFDVAKSENKKVGFKVRSPVATASVRGTAGEISSGGVLKVLVGMVGFGGPEASSAAVADAPSDFVPEDGTSTAFTPTAEVSGTAETPVFAGQVSQTNTVSGDQIPPQTTKANDTRNTGSSTTTLGAREGATPGNAIPTGTVPDTGAETGAQTFGTVTVNLTWN